MKKAHDTFLHFLSDNLSGIAVHPIRDDPDRVEAASFKQNALNVEFLDAKYDPHVCVLTVSLDLIHTSQITALDWLTTIGAQLSSAFYTPLLDYAAPATPVSAGSNLMWDRDSINFRKVASDHYAHYSCRLRLRFYPS